MFLVIWHYLPLYFLLKMGLFRSFEIDQIANLGNISGDLVATATSGVSINTLNHFVKYGNLLIGTIEIKIGNADKAAWTELFSVNVGEGYSNVTQFYALATWNATDNILESKRFVSGSSASDGTVKFYCSDALTKNKRYMLSPIISILSPS